MDNGEPELETRKKTWERRLDTCKKKHRPKLRNWSRDGFASHRNQEFKALQTLPQGFRGIVRLDARITGVKDFRDQFEKTNTPCIIENVPTVERWAATTNWSLPNLRENYKDRLFKVGEDDDGYKIKTKMKYFIDYLHNNKDDSPLYMFDGSFDDDSTAKRLLSDYKVPSYFPEDLFSLLGEEKRPPYRWLLVGPERSGTCVHLDPLGTSAWNTLLSGHKRWVLFPPNTRKSIAKGVDVLKTGEDDESINYFVDLLPRIKAKHGHELEILEVIQGPGETIYVPGGWWHGVINLDHTVAITQNYCSSFNFDEVWRSTRTGRKKMSQKWLQKLDNSFPALAQRALELNRIDEFTWPPRKDKKSKKDKKKVAKNENNEKKRCRSSDCSTTSEESNKSANEKKRSRCV